MTQSELNSVPLFSKVRAFWGNTPLDGYLIHVSGSIADIYIPSNFGIIYDYSASGITLIEEYRPDYPRYAQYNIETMPLFSIVSVSYQGLQKTGNVIDKSLNYNQLNVYYSDRSSEWIDMNYISLVSTPGPVAPLIKPPEEYTPGIRPPDEVHTWPDEAPQTEKQPTTETTGQGESKTGIFITGLIIILAIALIK